jgi:hypothetical protein
MADTGPPWAIPYVDQSDLVRDFPSADEAQALAIAAGLTDASVIRQVVSTLKTDTFTSTSASYVAVTGASVSITPQTNTNKVLVICYFVLNNLATAVGDTSFARITGGNAAAFVGDAAGSRTQGAGTSGNNQTNFGTSFSPGVQTLVYLDAPGVTTAVTYQLEVLEVGSGTAVIGRSGNDGNAAGFGRFPTTITAIEVAA